MEEAAKLGKSMCPKVGQPVFMAFDRSYKCGGEGHIARDCDSEAA